MAEEVKEYLDYDGLDHYDEKVKALFQDLTIEEVEEAFNELDESDPSYSAFYDVITKAKEAAQQANTNAAAAEAATSKANTATANADEATNNANEAADKVNELVESINDMTTGTNLLCGTREFRIGTQKVLNDKTICSDGFSNTGNFAITKDLEGYGVASLSASGLTSNKWAAIRGPLMPITIIEDEWFTISYELMVDDISALDEQALCYFYMLKNNDVASVANSYVARTFQLSANDNNVTIQSGIWAQVVHYLQIPKNANGLAYIYSGLQMPRNGSVHFKKLMVQRGKINHPIYAPNPNDIDYINDYTTGINLVRGSRDFRTGIIPFDGQAERYFSDGFRFDWNFTAANIKVNKYLDDEGFSVLEINPEHVAANKPCVAVSSNFFYKINTIYTASLEFSVDDVSKVTSNSISIYFRTVASTGAATYKKVDYTLPSNLEADKWYQVNLKLNQETATALTSGLQLVAGINQGSTVCLHIRKFMIQEGDINHPVYAPNPNDINYLNDETTGINLLRGTRDFVVGTDTNKNIFDVESDGFGISTKGTTIVGDDGFTELKLSDITADTYCDSSYFATNGIKEFTYFGKVKIDKVNSDDSAMVSCVFVKGSNTVSYQAFTTKKKLKIDISKTGVWQNFVWHITLNNDESLYGFVRMNVVVGDEVSFKQLGVYPGHIDNPIWSASPFDYASSYESNRPLETNYAEDLNDVSNGYHNWHPSTLNSPGTTYGTIHQWDNGVNKVGSRWIFQAGITTGNPGVFVYRSSINGSDWSPWQKLTNVPVA